MPLTDKQKQFCNEYIVDLNATAAAIRSGYSAKTARSIGAENLTKPDIRTFIDKLLDGKVLNKEETLKSISDIARASLNDYFSIRQVLKTNKVQVPLAYVIRQIEEEIEDAQKLVDRITPTDEDLKSHQAAQNIQRVRILELEIKLERNPGATTFIDGESYLAEQAELDLTKLIKDKQSGRIQKISFGEFGPKIELYAADAALRDLAKVHGLYEKDNSQRAQPIMPLSDDQFDKLRKEAREAATDTGK